MLINKNQVVPEIKQGYQGLNIVTHCAVVEIVPSQPLSIASVLPHVLRDWFQGSHVEPKISVNVSLVC